MTTEKPQIRVKLNKQNNENDGKLKLIQNFIWNFQIFLALIEAGKTDRLNSRENNDEDKKSGSSKLLQKAIPGILKKSKNLGDKNSPDESKNFIEKIGQKLIPEKFQRSVSNEGLNDFFYWFF